MSYKILTLGEKEEWTRLLEKLPIDQQDIYYTPEYYELYEENGDGQAMCFVFEKDDDIALYPFLKNSVNDLGYDLDDAYFDIQGAYGYNGVVSSNYNLSFRKEFYKTFYKYCEKKNIIAEFVRYNPIINNHLFAEDINDLFVNRKTVFLNLKQDYDEIFNTQYSSTNRNIIRKGQKTLSISNGNQLKDYNKFISMYRYTMHRIGANKYLHFNNQFFMNIPQKLSEHCFVFIANDNQSNIPLGALLLLIYKNKAHYFLSARSHLCDNNSVNNSLLDSAIRFSIKKECAILHLGGGNTLDDNDSLFKFKKNFSKENYFFYISKKIIQPTIYNSVCDVWEKKNPRKIKQFKNYLLKYHERNIH